MHIVHVVAGTNNPSNSERLAQEFTAGLTKNLPGCEIHTYRLRELSFAPFNLDCYGPSCPIEPEFAKFRDDLLKASGFLISTPVWNFSVPAHLKNLIDRMGSFALDENRSKGQLKGLPFFLIFTGGAPGAAWLALLKRTTSALPQSLQYFGASFIGQSYEGKCTSGRGKFGFVVGDRPESLAKAKKLGEGFASVIERYAKTGMTSAYHRLRLKMVQRGETFLKKFFR